MNNITLLQSTLMYPWIISGIYLLSRFKLINNNDFSYSFTINTTFKLRYLVNDSYYSDNRPIFFYTGNEGDISMFAQNTGFMFDLGKKIGALIVFAEHR